MRDDSASPDDPQSIPLFDLETPRGTPGNPDKRTGYSNSRHKRKTPLSTEMNALKSFVSELVFVIKITILQHRRTS